MTTTRSLRMPASPQIGATNCLRVGAAEKLATAAIGAIPLKGFDKSVNGAENVLFPWSDHFAQRKPFCRSGAQQVDV